MATNGPISNNPLPGILPPHGPMPGPPTRPNTGQTPVTPVPPILPPLIPPILPPTGPPVQRRQAQGGQGVTLCCVGFNPEDSQLEAIIEITSNLTEDFTTEGHLARVGFWINIGGTDNFIGEASVHFHYSSGNVKYAVRLLLTPDKMLKFIQPASTPQFATLKCLVKVTAFDSYLSYNWLEAAANPLGYLQGTDNYAFVAGDIVLSSPTTATIQFPIVSSWGKIAFRLRVPPAPYADPTESQVFGMHVSHLKNGKLLLFSGSGNDKYTFTAGSKTNAPPPILSGTVGIFDPVSGVLQAVADPPIIVDPNLTIDNLSRIRYYDMFCAGHSVLADGRIFVVGGTHEYDTDVVDSKNPHGLHFPGVSNTAILILTSIPGQQTQARCCMDGGTRQL